MAAKEAMRITIKRSELVCPICRGDKFWTRETLMNTAGATFFNFEWANKAATNYVCDSCGYVYWFLER